jgi:hypothetical protein
MTDVTLVDVNGAVRQVRLGSELARGGAGAVYQVNGDSSIVVKIYHPDTLKNEGTIYSDKIVRMLQYVPSLQSAASGIVQLAWPLASAHDISGKFVGFSMPTLDFQNTEGLDSFLFTKQAKLKNLRSDLGARITVAANLAGVVRAIHDKGHQIVDMKPPNLRFYRKDLYVAVLDCDGFQIQLPGRALSAPQVTVDYLAPEYQNKPIANPEHQDRFALAVIIFRLLNFGTHPYTGIARDPSAPTDMEGKISRGMYAYAITPHRMITPVPASAHDCFPDDLRRMFDRAFGSFVEKRPTSREWADVLKNYATRSNALLRQCCAGHFWFLGNSCGECQRERVLTGLPPTSPQLVSKVPPTIAVSAPGMANPHLAPTPSTTQTNILGKTTQATPPPLPTVTPVSVAAGLKNSIGRGFPFGELIAMTLLGAMIPAIAWLLLSALSYLLNVAVVFLGAAILIASFVAGFSGGFAGAAVGALIGWFLGFMFLPHLAEYAVASMVTWRLGLAENMLKISIWCALAASLVSVVKYSIKPPAASSVPVTTTPSQSPKGTTPVAVAVAAIILIGGALVLLNKNRQLDVSSLTSSQSSEPTIRPENPVSSSLDSLSDIPSGLYEDASWLATPTDWNKSGRLPVGLAHPDPGCPTLNRAATFPAEISVVEAGWLLLNSESLGDVTVVTGYLAYDARKCNTAEKMYFVFSGKKYAGSLTPAPTDGFTMRLERMEYLTGGLRAHLSFRNHSDPMCCYGHQVMVNYKFENGRLKFLNASKFTSGAPTPVPVVNLAQSPVAQQEIRSEVLVTVQNNHCFPQDYYVDGRTVATIPVNSSQSFSILSGQHVVTVCASGTRSCSDSRTVTWTSGENGQEFINRGGDCFQKEQREAQQTEKEEETRAKAAAETSAEVARLEADKIAQDKQQRQNRPALRSPDEIVEGSLPIVLLDAWIQPVDATDWLNRSAGVS